MEEKKTEEVAEGEEKKKEEVGEGQDKKSAADEVPVPESEGKETKAEEGNETKAAAAVAAETEVAAEAANGTNDIKDPVENGPPGTLIEPKMDAVALFKAAMAKAAAIKRPEVISVYEFSHCILSLSKAPDAAPELKALYEVLPKIGESCFVPLMGIRRSKKKAIAAPGESGGRKASGRVKSYNTKKRVRLH